MTGQLIANLPRNTLNSIWSYLLRGERRDDNLVFMNPKTKFEDIDDE